MMAVAMTMLVTVLPSAATMPMASTNSGKAMMVSEMRPTMRSVQPPKKPAAMPAKAAHGEDQRHREQGDDEVEPGRHHDAAEDIAAELVGAEPVRAGRRLQGRRGVARQRIVRHDVGADQRAERDQQEQREGEAGDRVLRDDVAGVAENRIARRLRPALAAWRTMERVSVILRASRADR